MNGATSETALDYSKVPLDLVEEPYDAIYEVRLDGRLIGRVARRRALRSRQVSRSGPAWRAQEPAPGGWNDVDGWRHSRGQAAALLLRA